MSTARWVAGVFIALVGAAAFSARADGVKLTIYDDGLSCPGGCDAHVVFHRSMNGTQFAHAPNSASGPYTKCTTGSACRVCFEAGGEQCLEVTYRGGGPPPMTFDFTPRFYEQACAAASVPPRLASTCDSHRLAGATLEGMVSCIQSPDVDACRSTMKQAAARQAADRLEYLRCLKVGESAYNSAVPKDAQRTHACAYERYGTGGPNSKGVTWKRLLPGVCRDGTFVGRDGVDCCSGVPGADAPMGRYECAIYYRD